MPGAASGFVDLQVNGYGGINFSSPELTVEQVFSVTQQLYQQGTLAFLPTVITAPWSTYEQVLPRLGQAIAATAGSPRLLGIHLEGPYISAEDGARGVHPRAHVRLPSCAEFDALNQLANGQVRLLTLAPELPGVRELIQHAVSLGVVVSLGHTMADSQAVRQAVQAGARASTHLGNGLPALVHRHQNPLWPQLAQPGLAAMLITDGHHLPGDFVRTVMAAKGLRNTIVTSDVSPAGGLPPGEYEFFGVLTRLEVNGRLHSPQTGTLAGSAATMLQCMNWLASLEILDEAGLWAVGRDNPLRLLGLAPESLPGGPLQYTHGRFKLAK